MKNQKKADLLQGTLELLLLRMLQSGPANGWDLMQRMQFVSKEVLRVTPGSLYPALHRLEARGLIASEWGSSENNRKAKFYEITSAGRRQLDAERKAWERFSGAIDLILRDA
jgi:PadR family transcriptional regulator PadR